jgi:hypothetical protein
MKRGYDEHPDQTTETQSSKRRIEMKTKFLAGLVVTLLVAAVGSAEKSLGLTLAQIEAERKAIIGEMIAPTEQQAELFWETYWQYRGGVKMLTDRTVAVIEEFAAAEGALSGDRSAALVLEVMDIEKRRAALKQSYVKKFQGVLTPSQVARWYQTERKMDAVIRANMAARIPFNDLASRSGAEITRADVRSGREALALVIVQPMEDQQRSFLYVYRTYMKKVQGLNDRIEKLIDEYVTSEASLSDDQAVRMTKAAAEIDADRVKALATMIYSLRGDLTGKQMARLMQGELKMNAVVDLALAALIPVHR